MKDVIRVEAWVRFQDLIEHLGGDGGAILDKAKVYTSTLLREGAFLPTTRLLDCMQLGAEKTGRMDLGLLWGDQFFPPNVGPLTLALVNAPSARRGLNVVQDFMHIHMPAFRSTITPVPGESFDRVTIDLTLPERLGSDLFRERWLALLNRRLIDLCGDDLIVEAVHFPHAPIAQYSAYQNVFGVVPKFSRDLLAIDVDRAVLDTERKDRSDEIYNLALSLLQTTGPARRQPLTATVLNLTRIFVEQGNCTVKKVADAIGLHERTMQRRLREEGRSFETIQDEARKKFAEFLLKDASIPISQVALDMGYSDGSAFTRSCRRWFGNTPSAVRRMLLS